MKKVLRRSIERIAEWMTVIILFTLVIGFVAALKQGNWVSMIIIITTFILVCLPRIIKEITKSKIPINFINIPVEFEIFIIIFIYATLFLGEIKNYYIEYWWWDTALHTSSGLAFGLIGFMILFMLYKGEKIKASPKIIAMFSFAFALAIGALWEIVEFTIDQTSGGSHWQGVGVLDTMKDLIVDSLGALVSSIAGYFYLNGKNEIIVKTIMKEFKETNTELFKKK